MNGYLSSSALISNSLSFIPFILGGKEKRKKERALYVILPIRIRPVIKSGQLKFPCMAFPMMIPVAYVFIVILASNTAEAIIGMNWGRQSAQRLVPSQVVDLLLQNGIKHARIYSSEPDILEAFAGSGINLTVGIYDATAFNSIEGARGWVKWKGPYFSISNTRGVVVGDMVFYKGLKDKNFLHRAINCSRFVQAALNEAGYGDQIKVTFQHYNGVLKRNQTKPSEAEFLHEIKEEMISLVRFLQENNAPFRIEMFPIFDTTWNNLDPSFAFPDNKSTQVIRDINGAVYTNVFEYVYDSFVWALNKINASNMKIIVGQVGWPTDGYPGASATAAERFFKSLLPLVASNKGTPMRPGVPIDVFVHALTDENRLPYESFPFTRHWGIYRSNGEPKYKIDVSGQGRDIFPTTIKGVMHMPQRWCILNGNQTNVNKVKSQFDKACAKADCTSLAPGGSCSQLSFHQNISYAFNMLFQFQFQDEKTCDFGGLGYVTVNDPSTSQCVFPVEVVRGKQQNYGMTVGGGFHERPICAIFVLLLSIWGTLIWA